ELSRQMTTSTTSIDIMGLQAAYANLHTDQERDYFMQRYHDVISSFGGKRSEERFSRNAETDFVCGLLLEKKKKQDVASSRPGERPMAKGLPVTTQGIAKHLAIAIISLVKHIV